MGLTLCTYVPDDLIENHGRSGKISAMYASIYESFIVHVKSPNKVVMKRSRLYEIVMGMEPEQMCD